MAQSLVMHKIEHGTDAFDRHQASEIPRRSQASGLRAPIAAVLYEAARNPLAHALSALSMSSASARCSQNGTRGNWPSRRAGMPLTGDSALRYALSFSPEGSSIRDSMASARRQSLYPDGPSAGKRVAN
jgi:hypothetical protein